MMPALSTLQALLALYQEHKDEFHANRREELAIIA